jgi:uncharacterized membrane protein YwzB
MTHRTTKCRIKMIFYRIVVSELVTNYLLSNLAIADQLFPSFLWC